MNRHVRRARYPCLSPRSGIPRPGDTPKPEPAASSADPEAEEEPGLVLLDRRETVPASRLQRLETLLEASERLRHAAFRQVADRERFLLARAARGGLTTHRTPWQTALFGWPQLQPQPFRRSGCAGPASEQASGRRCGGAGGRGSAGQPGLRRQHIGEGGCRINLRRFSRYWRRAEPVLWARAGAGAPPARARRWGR